MTLTAIQEQEPPLKQSGIRRAPRYWPQRDGESTHNAVDSELVFYAKQQLR